MGGFVLKRSASGGNDCGDYKHYFSVLSPEDLSVSENVELPFKKDKLVAGGSCGDLVHFHGDNGKIVIYNFETYEIVVFPPPEVLNAIYLCEMRACGVGSVGKGPDYKVIRIYQQIQWNEGEVDEEGEVGFWDATEYFDMYSMPCGSLKEITRPTLRCSVLWGTSVYIEKMGTGSGISCWIGVLYGDSPANMITHVLSFDFSTESFDQFPLPTTALTNTGKGGANVELVGCRGSLGALVFWRPYDEFSITSPPALSSELSIQLFVRRGTSWDLLYSVSLADVERPLGLKDDRLLFLEAKPSDGLCQLMVYDLASKTLKKLDIYDRPRIMSGISYGRSSGKAKKSGKRKGKGKGKKRNHIPGNVAGESSQQHCTS